MTHKDIKYGTKYENGSGKTRLVIGKNQSDRESEILYKDQDNNVRMCLGSTFIKWLKG